MRRRGVVGSCGAALAALALLCLATASHARDTRPGSRKKAPLFETAAFTNRVGGAIAVAFDAVLLRPMGALKTGTGLALFVPVSVLSAAEGSDARQEAWERFVAGPAEDTFRRPLGDF